MRTVVAIQLMGIVLNLPRSDLCKFGTNCDYPCHCQNSAVCDPLDGSCTTGCDDGDLEEPGDYWYTGAWGGYGCQLGNVAYGKNATQGVDTYYGNSARLAVDGNNDPTLSHGYCSHSIDASLPHEPSWWQVDLGVNFVIYGVGITNRDGYRWRSQFMDITVSDTEGDDRVQGLCHRIGSEGSAPHLSVNCSQPLRGRYVRLQRRSGRDAHIMNICEVQVRGYLFHDCPETYYGVGCGTPCNCQLPCHDISGECPQENCTEGWMGYNCQTVCNPGTWGTNCQRSCNCLDDQEECDRFKGRCNSGCHSGFGGIGCNLVLPMLISSTVEFSDSTSNSIEVRFNAWVPGDQEEHIPSGYIVQRRDSGNATWLYGTEIDHDIDTVQVLVVLRGLEPESEYYLRVVPFIVDGGQMSLGYPTSEVGPFRTLRNEVSEGSVSVGVIMSVVLVLAVIILIIGGVLLFFRRRKSRKKANESVRLNSGIAQLQRTVAESEYEIPKSPSTPGNEYVYATENNNEDKTSRETPEYAEIADPKITAEMNRHDGYDAEYEDVMVEEPDPVDHTYGNQVFIGRPLRADELGPYMEEMSRRKDAFKEEFTQIPAGMTAKANEGLKTINRKLNRFNDISAYDHSRVILNCSPEESHCTDYINASYIHNYKGEPKRYIAAQGPKKSTVGDMWSMVWQACANRIVMLTNLIDAGKVKCEQYWPSQGVATYGQYKVTQVNTEMFANYTIRILSLAHANGESRPVYQFHFTGWPDYEVPELTTAILDFRRKVHSYDDKAKGPMIVHCSAGVGRTGAFLAIDTLLDQLKDEGRVDVLRYTALMRNDRVNMIQTLAQYVFVYEMLLEATQIGETAIPSNEMEARYTELQLPSTATGRSAIDEQFAVLRLLRKKSKPRSGAEALIKGNEMKNRDPKVVPLEKYRPHLNTSIEGTNDYINAVNVDGYRECKAYTATQLPLPDTVVDLWRMLYERKCSSIVSLQQPNHDDESTPVFWPTEEDTPMIVKGLSVTLLKEEVLDEGDIKMMEFEIAISMKNPSDTRVIRMYQLLDWQTGKVPPSLETTLKLLDHAERWQMRSGLGGICYQCMYGYERCGLMIAACYMLEKLKVDREADVFQAVKQVRISRPEFVTSKSQYRFLHELAIAYINSCDDYANFK